MSVESGIGRDATQGFESYLKGGCWEPKATVWQGHYGLAAFQQGQNLQVHHVSIMVGRNAKWFPLTEKKFILSQGHWQ
jgi:hypothetical protein